MSLDKLADELHQTALEKGFWDTEVDANFVLAKLALVASEVSEVLEAYRKDMGSEKIVEEIADILIRTLDLYAGLYSEGIVLHSLDTVLDNKSSINKNRDRLHGNKI